ncbi:MAG TPA: hypothetical protein VJQ59_13550 [Candidatus Sulfotelmatobacter sp.]|nr:hypothetical protein [Candidatus Sulfotelmatobacter sp.]
MVHRFVISFVLLAGLSLPMLGQDSEPRDKNLDIKSPIGNLHVGADADAKKIGLPLYPGARLKTDDNNSDQANLSLLTESFGMKLVVANYVSNASPDKILDFYRGKLKRYGKVLECRSDKHGGDVDVHNDKDSNHDKALKCDDNSGPVTELKVGTEDDQHIVSVEPNGTNGETKFALVYVRTRGKSGDI